MPLRPPRISTWMYFRVPTTINLEDTTGPHTEAIEPIRHAEGQMRCAWGRVQSDPEMTVLFIAWISYDEYNKFINSSPAQTFYSGLATLNPTPTPANIPIIVVLFPNITLSRPVLYPNTHIRAVFFPQHSLSEARRQVITKHPGPVYTFGFGSAAAFEAISGYRQEHKIGWLDGPLTWPDNVLPGRSTLAITSEDAGETSCEVLTYVMSWKSSDAEQRFWDNAKSFATGEIVPTIPAWENTLKENGAIGWKDLFVDFHIVERVRKKDGLSEEDVWKYLR